MSAHPSSDLSAAAAWMPNARPVPFASFNGRYAGRGCHVIGRGPTTFDYAALAAVDEPVLFINDAVCLERHARGETFFFAHDPQALRWLDGGLRSTAVLPADGKVFRPPPPRPLRHAGPVVLYRWRTLPVDHVLRMGRDALAAAAQLYTHTATIHSLLHFAWFCGFRRVTFVGCDGHGGPVAPPVVMPGVMPGYDPRLENRSGSAPTDYAGIVHVQRLLTDLFGLEAVYRGTPNRE